MQNIQCLQEVKYRSVIADRPPFRLPFASSYLLDIENLLYFRIWSVDYVIRNFLRAGSSRSKMYLISLLMLIFESKVFQHTQGWFVPYFRGTKCQTNSLNFLQLCPGVPSFMFFVSSITYQAWSSDSLIQNLMQRQMPLWSQLQCPGHCASHIFCEFLKSSDQFYFTAENEVVFGLPARN